MLHLLAKEQPTGVFVSEKYYTYTHTLLRNPSNWWQDTKLSSFNVRAQIFHCERTQPLRHVLLWCSSSS